MENFTLFTYYDLTRSLARVNTQFQSSLLTIFVIFYGLCRREADKLFSVPLKQKQKKTQSPSVMHASVSDAYFIVC